MTGTAAELAVFLLGVIRTDPDKEWSLTEHRKKRSLSQNAYYWVLTGAIAKAMKLSTAEVHNRNLRQYSRPEIFGGKIARALLPDTEETEEKALQMTTAHLKPTSQTVTLADGITYRTYDLMRGSSDLNTDEMAYLIDKTEEDARALGIDTATPEERRRMYELQAQAEQSNSNTSGGKTEGRRA